MAMRIPFFGLISLRSPMLGLLEHYEQIAKGMELIEGSMECYITSDGHACQEFSMLQNELNAVEEHADTIKRYIRNHLPSGIFFPVDKHLFFTYTRTQDDILDAAQDSLQWIAMRDVTVPEEFQRDVLIFIDEVSKCVQLLKPALEGTVAWVHDEGIERNEVKVLYRNVRQQHKVVSKIAHELRSRFYNSKMDFKDIYQLIHFVEKLHVMSHSVEDCADMLRIMIAR